VSGDDRDESTIAWAAEFANLSGAEMTLVHTSREAASIHDQAAGFQADLIITGRGGHKLGRLTSDDYQIIRDAPCPVISI